MKCTISPLDIIIFKRCRVKAKQIILESKRSSSHNYCNSLKSNSHLAQFWRTIKKFPGQSSCYHIPSLHQNWIIAKNNQHKKNVLAQKFHSFSTTHLPGFNTSLQNLCLKPKLANLSTSPQNSNLNFCFSLPELKRAINDTKSTEPGADNLRYEIFKHMSNVSLNALLTLLNGIWASSDLPPAWLHSIIIPIPKPKKRPHLPSSYRTISLSSNVCKPTKKFIVRRLKWYLEYNNKLSCRQSGFRNRRKTIDYTLRLHDIVQKSLAKKHSVLAVFTDIEKAYHVVRKEVIMAKLITLGINGRMLKFISFYLTAFFKCEWAPHYP